MIARRAVLALGAAQLISWGTTYYLIGGFGELIAADFGWSRDRVYGGFSLALLVMGVASPLIGRMIDRHGGRRVMVVGSLTNAAGCGALALSNGFIAYLAAWIVLGLGMRLTLYDAAFAALARIGGREARRPIAEITLLGGLASSCFWPIGHLLAELFGWRGAVLAFGLIALTTLPLHLAIPDGRQADMPADEAPAPAPARAASPRDQLLAGWLYAGSVALVNFFNSGMSAHMIGILSGLGLAASLAVWVATLRGIGQSLARLAEVIFGRRVDPLSLNLGATALLPACFAAGFFSGAFFPAALAFAFLYGAGNGLLTITRGTLPLMLFDHRTYGAVVGRLLVPGFFVSAAAPLVYAMVIERFGEAGALWLSLALTIVSLAAALVLKLRFG